MFISWTKRGVWTVDGSQFQTGGYGNNHVKYSINLAVYSSSFSNSIQGRYSSNTYGVNSIKQYNMTNFRMAKVVIQGKGSGWIHNWIGLLRDMTL